MHKIGKIEDKENLKSLVLFEGELSKAAWFVFFIK